MLLSDLLLAAKNDDRAKLQLQIAEMEIPESENWFAHTFGQEKGARLAGIYGKSQKTSELQFQMLCAELAKQGGEVLVEKVDVAKRYGTLPGPLDAYTADWKKTDDSVGPDTQQIGVFYFIDGKFRADMSLQTVRILSAVKSGQVVAGKLINRVKPEYPPLARQAKIEGLVSVNVIIHKDGTVTVQNVGAGHPLLVPAAVAAVQQ